MPKYTVDLFDVSSWNKLKNDIDSYRNTLDEKCKTFVMKLTKIAENVVRTQVNKANATMGDGGVMSGVNSQTEISSTYSFDPVLYKSTITISGKEVMFIEFGSGVYYNGEVGRSPNPKGNELGYVIGSYGKGKGRQSVWGYYDESGELVLTHGVEATMPMYKAIMEVYKQAKVIAKEVFL